MKSDRFKQNNPKDQLRAIIMALEGNFQNWKDGILPYEEYDKRVTQHLKDLEDLEPHVQGEWT